MSIKNVGACIVFVCDECGEQLDNNEDDFKVALALARDDGWRADKDIDGWQHYCPECGE